MEIKTEWFEEENRKTLRDKLAQRTDKLNTALASPNLTDLTQQEYTYRMASIQAEAGVSLMLMNLLIDTSTPRPWFIKHHKYTVSRKELQDILVDVVDMLINKPPSTEYSALVYYSRLLQIINNIGI